MGAKSKEGLSFFPVDINIFKDPKILMAQEIIDPEGNLPFCRFCVPYVAIRILKEVYENGYYKVWNKSICLEVVSEIGNGLTYNLLMKIINSFFEVEFLSHEMFLKYNVITSHGIQKRWLGIMKNYRRTKKSIRPELLLLTEHDELEKNNRSINAEEIDLFATEMPISAEEMPISSRGYDHSFSILNTNSNNSSTKEYNNTVNTNKERKEGIYSEDISNSATKTTISSEDIPVYVVNNINPSEEIIEIEEEIAISSEEKKMAVFKTEKFIKKWRIYKKFRKQQHNFEYKSFITEQHAQEALWKESQGNEEKAYTILDTAIANGWKGFFKAHENKNLNNGRFGNQNGNGSQPTGGNVKIQSAFSKLDAMHSSTSGGG